MHNRQGLTLSLLWQALSDWDMWPIYLLGFTLLIPTHPILSYLTLNIRNLGFDTFQTNLLTVPVYVLFNIQLILWSWVSERINNRFLIVLLYSAWCFPLFIVLRCLPDDTNAWVRYALTVLIGGSPYVHSILGRGFLIIMVGLTKLMR